MKIGVLALQGAFLEHINVLGKLGAEAVPVRLAGELEGLKGLIIPGGESTSILTLVHSFGLAGPIKGLARNGLAILGTCAGMVCLASKVCDTVPGMEALSLMNIGVRRNAFGRQVNSFETELEIPVLGGEKFHGVFIRAPIVEEVGPGVEVLTSLPDGTAVATRQGRLLATAFHPELSNDLRFHRYFLEMVASG